MGNDQIDQILKLTRLLGAKEVVTYIKEYKLSERRGHRKENICFDIIVAFENGDIKADSPSDYEEFINKGNEGNASWEALDLIKHLLKLDYVRIKLYRKGDSLLNRLWSIRFLMVSEISCCILFSNIFEFIKSSTFQLIILQLYLKLIAYRLNIDSNIVLKLIAFFSI